MDSLKLSTPHIIAMVGIPGAGKTYFASQFSETFGSPYLDQELFNMIFSATDDSAGFAIISRVLFEIMKTRQTIVYEGPLDKRVYRTNLTDFAKKNGYKVLFVWVQTDEAVAKTRWHKTNQANNASYQNLINDFSAPHISENQIIISGRHTYNTQVRTILKYLSPKTPSATDRKSASGRLISRGSRSK